MTVFCSPTLRFFAIFVGAKEFCLKNETTSWLIAWAFAAVIDNTTVLRNIQKMSKKRVHRYWVYPILRKRETYREGKGLVCLVQKCATTR